MKFDPDPPSADSPYEETHVPYLPLPSESPQEPASPAPAADSQATAPPWSVMTSNRPAPRYYEGAVAVSLLCVVLTLTLMFFTVYSLYSGPISSTSYDFFCGLGPTAHAATYSGLGAICLIEVTLLVLSILSALFARAKAEASKEGANLCLGISIACLPLVGLVGFFGLFACAG